MIIRAKTFRKWVEANLKDSLRDIASHGVDGGFPGITYTSDCVDLFNKFENEIWDMAVDDAESSDQNVAEFIGGFRRKDMLETMDCFKNLMVWFAVEKIANEKGE